MKALKTALVGCGRIGQLHANNLSIMPQFELVAACDPIHQINGIKHYQCHQDLLAKEHFDAVMICSPSAHHITQIIDFARADKAIFCEKPLGLNEPDILEVIHVCQQQDVILQVGFNRRFDLDFANVKQAMNAIAHFTPHVIKITSRDSAPPSEEYLKNSGGIFFDMMIHDFDMLRFLTDCEVTSVYAQGSRQANSMYERTGDFSNAVVHLSLDNDCQAIIENSRQTTYGYDQRIEVYDNQVTFKVANVSSHHMVIQNKQGITSANPKDFFIDRYVEAYRRQLQAFYVTVCEGEKLTVGGVDGLRAHQLAEAASRSAKTKQVIYLR